MTRRPGRSTPQRQAILDAVRAHSGHPCADDVFFAVRRTLPAVSLGTVYRNLRMFVERGTIVELVTADGVRRYDTVTAEHGHAICRICGRITDIRPPAESTAEIVRAAERETAYRVESHRVELTGVCPTCAEERVEEDG